MTILPQFQPNENPATGEQILDLYRTSHTQAKKLPARCANNAPFIVYSKLTAGDVKTWHIAQGCCDAWRCPRCGQIRAKQEYWRMVFGAESLSMQDFNLYAMTITCLGGELAQIDAERDYGVWTNKLLNALRNYARRNDLPWYFAAVTERQKRGHPHSHIVTTFCPLDAAEFMKVKFKRLPDGILQIKPSRQIHLWSDWLQARIVAAGLGEIYDLSPVRDARAASRYFAKYLFKSTVAEIWPPGWRRVRYSRSWPNIPFGDEPNGDAFPVVKKHDWNRVQLLGDTVIAEDRLVYEMARHRVSNVVMSTERSKREADAPEEHRSAASENRRGG